ncbi:hypothetical protein PTSG_07135 [Salpingoeca rosetta]|uniref:Holocytochrome c-type synthase n=1 Tax=Salpingoeca rosetta (strain ATCC 50818 / BSB-021) TaxID=946362 RepID=F2UE57_SALR5|nr:uncharacterized protein PTSG_07135 [Salpingoeca rosetta]EGD74907.1 hypothetical protein PTSG_07135 [Salpingoeca rosetta]|eukprot:XP_004992552.1 hypothetical protein PTSG_07135 [Salpingoeca rosetta]
MSESSSNSSGSSSTGKAAGLLSGGCPVLHKRGDKQQQEQQQHQQQQQQPRTEPPDTPDRPINLDHAAVKVEVKESDHPYDQVPDSVIPAAGRGNSDDGKAWLNPSAHQLFRALKRKDKPIDYEDALVVAQVHEMVTDFSWKAVMEYERLHQQECPNVTLARFEGKDGIYSPKARILKTLFGYKPFDRHDWTVDRCGKEVRYILDYYAYDNGEGDIEYTVDARPAGVGGMVDRFRVAFTKWRNGESWY